MAAFLRCVLSCLVLFTRLALSGCGAEDSTLNVTKRCGEAQLITMTYDSTQRDVWMYIPSLLCDENTFTQHINAFSTSNTNSSNANTVTTLPMMLALHCLGCAPSHELAKWQSFAEEFTFVLMAPQGVQSSWNADVCCD